MTQDMNEPADLTLWPTAVRTKTAECRPQPNLREALRLAVQAIEAGAAKPWIITAAGDILAPAWIEANGRRLLSAEGGDDALPMAA
jgi:hypothetical protein